MNVPEPSAEMLVPPAKKDPETLALRGPPRPVVRFRRGLIAAIAAAFCASLAALAWIALEPPGLRVAPPSGEAAELPGKAPAEALSGAPLSYGDAPRLGPPLPGDLGRPILSSGRTVEAAGTDTVYGREANEAEERRRAEAAIAQARSSGLLVASSQAQAPAAPAASNGPGPAIAPPAAETPAAKAGPAGKAEFAGAGEGGVNSASLEPPASRWMLSAGTVIPASLVTGLNSDLPGMVVARVTRSVMDSATGQAVLIPQGARLIGSYDSLVSYGQRRALLVWQRIVFPDGSSIRLGKVPATDAGGYAGLSDKVDSHSWQLLKGIALSTLLGVAGELAIGGEGEIARALRQSAQGSAAGAGNGLASRNLDIQPTLTVRPGWRVNAILREDLLLEPWRG